MRDTAPLMLALDGQALTNNWHWLARQSYGAACGAAVKADGYGLGATGVVSRLLAAGCRDFFVATWDEAAELLAGVQDWPDNAGLSILHGVRNADMTAALATPAWVRPVLNTEQQVARWASSASTRACDVMFDTGMNRLGLHPAMSGGLAGRELAVHTVMSHLASADEADAAQNTRQRDAFAALAVQFPGSRHSLANSAGILLGSDYTFGLTRPGLALYGGQPTPRFAGHIQTVVQPRAAVIQRRTVQRGDAVGYNATYAAPDTHDVAILNIGYADGYFRGFSDRGAARFQGATLPVVGRVSMDLLAVRIPDGCSLSEGDWVDIDFDLPTAAAASGMSQYELLTSLGHRYRREWR